MLRKILHYFPYFKSSPFKGWHFDIGTSILTVIIIPTALYLSKILLSRIKRLSAYALEGILYALSRSVVHSLAASLSLRRYCRTQLESDAKHLFVPSSRDIKLDIDNVFVTLTLDYQGAADKQYNHRNMLTIANRIRVIGDPGSGKSSLTKKLFRDACQRAVRKPRKSRLPIRVELKTLKPPKNLKGNIKRRWLYEHLLQIAKGTDVYRMDECFENYAKTQGLLILLDGLDEVSAADYPRFKLIIEGLDQQLANLGGNSIVVLTMRTQFHQQVKEDFREQFGPAVFIKPFSPTDIYEFLTKWPFQTNTNGNISRIYKELTDRPTLREMCANPLILSMYVAEDQTSRQILSPESRTQFYSKVTDELILKRRLQQTGPQPAPTKLKEQRERILGRLCYEHLLNPDEPTNSLSWKQGIEVAKSVWGCDEAEAEQRFRELSSETGLFTEERVGESFRFIHLTICEFLAAFETVQGQKDGWDELLKTHKSFLENKQLQIRSRLLEVIPFACGLLPRIQRGKALADVGKLGDFRLMARCFFETKLYEHPTWENFIHNAQKSLLGTDEKSWDERWLGDLHLINLVVRDAELSSAHVALAQSTIDLSAFYQNLVSRRSDSLSKLLNSYAAQDAAAVFRIAEICEIDLPTSFPTVIIDNCDQPPFLALVIEQIGKEEIRSDLWASLLVESALRSPVVAHSLDGRAKLDSLKNRDGLPVRNRWYLPGLTHDRLYTQLVSLATTSQAIAHLPCLSALTQLRAPAATRARMRMERGSVGICGIAVAAAPLALEFYSRSNIAVKYLPVSIFIFTSLIYALTFYALQRIRGRIYTYSLALNLEREGVWSPAAELKERVAKLFRKDQQSDKEEFSKFQESFLKLTENVANLLMPKFLLRPRIRREDARIIATLMSHRKYRITLSDISLVFSLKGKSFTASK